MNDRAERLVLRQVRGLALAVHRFIQPADEGDGAAGDQRQANATPIFAGGVVDNGPTFECGFLRTKQQAVTGLPDRGGNCVAGHQAGCSGAGRVDEDTALFAGSGRGQGLQIAAQLALDFRACEAKRGDRAEVDRAEIAGIEQ